VAVEDPDVLRAGPGRAIRSDNGRVAEALASHGLGTGRVLGTAAHRRAAGALRFYALESGRPDFDPLAAAAALRAAGRFRAVCPDYRLTLFDTVPDDYYLPLYQWYIDDGGFADIRLPAAWDVEQGDPSVVIAIMDTGVDTGHPDLASKIWSNPGEVPGNSIDDDGNGLVDDVQGWDFGGGDGDANPEALFDEIGLDIGFHGTFCAGLAGAATDNTEGIASAGWACRIMPLKVSNPTDGISTSAVTEAFAYAADQGAAVISMSFGGPGDPGVPEYFQALVDDATAAGSLCVAAAGNDGDNVPVYPAACADVVAVGATDLNDERASFSNYGPWVDVAAPGGLIWSTICRNYEVDEVSQLFYIFFFGWDGENPYMFGDGTSFACPLAAGVCGLIRARYPAMNPQQVAHHLVTTGDVVAYDQPIGPRVNAFAAVSQTPVAVEPLVAGALALAAATPNPFTAGCDVSFVMPEEGRARLSVFDVTGRRVRVLADGIFGSGPQRVRWDGRDDLGRGVGAGVYVARLEASGGARERKLVRVGR
jgi:subtilisin family serine protease